ncbi:MAG: DUF2892 domain-containing protein [Bdellovibrionales bacterium]|nr:DUF2892 domain-containing protein [Bdellovibrionales bacterium]
MTKNIKAFERVLRLSFGVFLLGWAVAGGPWWAYLGVILIATASWGFCPMYWLIQR